MDLRARKLADLVEQNYAILYRYAYRLTGSTADAEDLTQEAFLTAQARWEQLRDETRARSWLFTIARNAWLKQKRGPAGLPTFSLNDAVEPVDLHDEPDIDQEQLQSLLNDLPEDFRSPLVLFYFGEFSYREIAEQMGVPIGTVMSRLSRARAWLRRRLTEADLAETGLAEASPACAPRTL
jgi:RNA polymerase sigma-70 factor (ECF subfamily)